MASLLRNFALLLLLLAGQGASTTHPSVYPVDEYVFEAVVDHYSFRPTPKPTFPLRYFVNGQHWNGTGPCFFYAGNEANIFQFINNSGFIFESSVEFGALVVFAEHRYYGESNVVGALDNQNDLSFLTVEQAMADFNTLTVHIRTKWSMSPDTAFIVFGGSYGGNLAMWLRLKNPNLWAGAIASSATPLKHVLRETNGFALIETQAYGNVSLACPKLVRSGWTELYEQSSTPKGRIHVAQALGLCDPLPDVDVAEDVHGWVSGALETMVQYGYPYPTQFYNPVPAYPFQVACYRMLQASTGLGALRAAINVYYNYTGQAGPCFDFDSSVVTEARMHWNRKGDLHRIHLQDLRKRNRQELNGIDYKEARLLTTTPKQSDEDEENAWEYQTCTEVYQPMPTDGTTDFEIPYAPNQTAYFEHCWNKYDVQPRPNWEEMHFMGSNIGAGSNIFLTSGQLDPWRAAGIQETPKGSPDSIVVRIIENGAHHLDLRGGNPLDPPSVASIRIEEKACMHQWIKEWKEQH
eukprot:scaffold110730_cov59-Attheya_sp.AAC.8